MVWAGMALLVLWSSLGCAAYMPKYYSVEYDFAQHQDAMNDDLVQTLHEDAKAVIRQPEVTIAFYPPDMCRRDAMEATPTTAEQTAEFVEMECGVLMSELERAAAMGGYQVVSWQLLRHAEANPFYEARELGVDLLFEIDELSTGIGAEGQSAVTDISFYEQVDLDTRESINLESVTTVAERCIDRYGQDMVTQLQVLAGKLQP